MIEARDAGGLKMKMKMLMMKILEELEVTRTFSVLQWVPHIARGLHLRSLP